MKGEIKKKMKVQSATVVRSIAVLLFAVVAPAGTFLVLGRPCSREEKKVIDS